MFRINVFFLLLAASGVAMAQPAAPVKIPFQLRDNLVSMQAVINGEKASAVLDSGAGTLAVSNSFAAKLGLKPGHSSVQVKGAGAGSNSASPIKLDTLQFGPLALHNLSGYALSFRTWSSSAGYRIDALLGYPIFKSRAVRVNYATRHVVIYPKGVSPACHNPIPIKIIHNVPVVTAKIKVKAGVGAKTVHLVVDLGSRHYSYLGDAFLKTKIGKTLFPHGHKQVVGHGAGGRAKGVVVNVAELSVGTQQFHDVTFALTKQAKGFNLEKIQGSLGVPLWKGGVITFDYPDSQLCINTAHQRADGLKSP